MRRVARLVGISVTAVSLVAAGGAAAASPLPPLSSKCGDTGGVDAQPFHVRTSDGVELYTIEAGSGSTALVLLHESPANVCGWLPYIPSLTSSGLTSSGFRVLAFDLRGFSDSISRRVRPPAPTTATWPRWSPGHGQTGRSECAWSARPTAGPSR